jgi:hypothetical protein
VTPKVYGSDIFNGGRGIGCKVIKTAIHTLDGCDALADTVELIPGDGEPFDPKSGSPLGSMSFIEKLWWRTLKILVDGRRWIDEFKILDPTWDGAVLMKALFLKNHWKKPEGFELEVA